VPARALLAVEAFPVTEGTNGTKIQKHRPRDLAVQRLTGTAAAPPLPSLPRPCRRLPSALLLTPRLAMTEAWPRLEARLRGLFSDLDRPAARAGRGPTGVAATLAGEYPICAPPAASCMAGAIMAFADTLGAVARVLNVPEGAGTATIESKTNSFRPATVESTVTGTTTPLNKGRRTQTWGTRATSASRASAWWRWCTQTQMVL
jgi:uncharacterized protein (TIGR00369 family)